MGETKGEINKKQTIHYDFFDKILLKKPSSSTNATSSTPSKFPKISDLKPIPTKKNAIKPTQNNPNNRFS